MKSNAEIKLKCKNECGLIVEESKMAHHLHECPNKPKNSLMDIVMSKDANEEYIPEPQWPSNMPHTKQVYDIIKKLGLEPPFELPQEEVWISVESKGKKPKTEIRRGRR